MNNEIFSIHLQESDGMKVWEMDEIPQPNNVICGMAYYHGQNNVEKLLKILNHKAFMNNEECFLNPLFSIIECSLEQGVEDEGTIQWDDRSYYTKISWTSYSWKLPPNIKRRRVQIAISKVGEPHSVGNIQISLKKIADDGGDIRISPKMISKLNLDLGNAVTVKIRFSH